MPSYGQSRIEEGPFLRPTWSRGQSTEGVTIDAAGIEIGGRFHHLESDLEWSLELGYGRSTQSLSVPGITATITDHYFQLPWLNLRYYIPNDWDSIHPFVSATMGATLLQRNFDVRGLVNGSGSLDNAYLLSFGLGAGVTYNITKKITIEAGYRYLWHSELDFNPFNDLESLDSFSPLKNYPNTGIVTIGLSFSF